MLQRNLLFTGVTRGKRLVVLVGQKKAVAIAVRNVSGPAALVEAGGMAQRGRREALRECMMAGVTEPPWRSRFYLASGKVGNKSIGRFEHALGTSLYPQLLTYRCGASNRRFGAKRRHPALGLRFSR
jgi:hypothetical protein